MLASDDIWEQAKSLRAQALRKSITVLDTSQRTPVQAADFIEEQVLSRLERSRS